MNSEHYRDPTADTAVRSTKKPKPYRVPEAIYKVVKALRSASRAVGLEILSIKLQDVYTGEIYEWRDKHGQ